MIEIIENLDGSEIKIKFIGKTLLIERNAKNGKLERVLVVGDLHLGFGEIMGISGVNVGKQMFDEMINDFNEVFGETGNVDKIILLGDIKHDFGGILKQEWSDVAKIIDYLKEKCKKLILIRGNHDTLLSPIARKKKLKVWNLYVWNEFCFTHGDRDYNKIWNKKVKYIVVGHGHPAVKLKEERGAKIEKYKCFLVGKGIGGKKMIIVPSFAEYYVGSDPREGEVILAWDVDFSDFEVYVVGEHLEVLNFGLIKKLR